MKQMLHVTRTAIGVALIFVASIAAHAQVGDLPVTREELDSRVQAIKASQSIDEDTRTRILDLYTQASDALARAMDWQSKIREFDAAINEAPSLLTAIEAELQNAVSGGQGDLDDKTLAEIEQLLSQAHAESSAVSSEATQLQAEPARRAERRRVIPDLLVAARAKLQEIQAMQTSAATPDGPEELAVAQDITLRMRKANRELEVQAYEKELQSYEVRGQLLTQRIARSTRQAAALEQRVASLSALVDTRRQQDARDSAVETRELASAIEVSSPALRAHLETLLESNAQLNDLRNGADGILARIRSADEELSTLSKRVQELRTDMTSTKDRVDAAGSSVVAGYLLRQQADDLPNVRVHQKRVTGRRSVIASVQIEQIDAREQWLDLVDLDAAIEQEMSLLPEPVATGEFDQVRKTVGSILEARQKVLDALLKEYDSYFAKLVDLDGQENQLVALTEEFEAYIAERVLFIRSGGWPDATTIRDGGEALGWLLDPASWRDSLSSATSRAFDRIATYLGLIALLVLMLALRPRVKHAMRAANKKAAKSTCTEIQPTVVAALCTVILSAPVPYVLLVSGAFFAGSESTVEQGRILGDALIALSWNALFVLYFMGLLSPHGVAIDHFSWPDETTRRLQSLLRRAMPVALIGAGLAWFVEIANDEASKESLGRLAFIIALVAVIYVALGVLRGSKSVFDTLVRGKSASDRRIGLQSMKFVLLLAPPALILGAISGFYYTSLRIGARLAISAYIALGIAFIAALALRWLLMERRHVAREQAKLRRALAKNVDSNSGDAPTVAEEDLVDLHLVDTQNQRLVRGLAYALLLVGLWMTWRDMVPAFQILNQVELGTTTQLIGENIVDADGIEHTEFIEQSVPITLRHLVLAAFVILVTIVATRNIPGVLEISILKRMDLPAGERYAITSVTRYALFAIGAIMAFDVLGIGWNRMQWLVAALGLGLGFGLQEIFANFVSGLILLFERPIRIGDTVTIGGIHGTVSKIRIRATTITDFNRKELVVPNKEFVTGQLVNWTLSDSVLRIVIPVGVSYDSNVELVEETLLKVAQDSETVLEEPKPFVLFEGFGDNTLNFELRVHCRGIQDFIPLRHEMHMTIVNAFRKVDIEIAYPQRDLHIRSVDPSVSLPKLDKEDR